MAHTVDEHAGEIPPYREHLGAGRQYLRDIILGVNDGLVSMFLLVVGVVGAGFASREVLLAGIAGTLAGAVSMAAGEYIATKSQEEVFEGEIELEWEHFEFHRDQELDELREMLGELGLEGQLLEDAVEVIDRDDDTLMHAMKTLEFGLVESERRSPFRAMVLSGLLFIVGAMPAVLPFAFIDRPHVGLSVAALACGVGLAVVGALKTLMTRGRPVVAAVENLAVGVVGGAAAYGIGALFDRVIS